MKHNLTGFSSRAIHNGFKGDTNRSHNTPIYATSTYYYDSVEQGADVVAGLQKGFLYQRYGSPNSIEVEEKICSLESHGLDIKLKGIMHASGQAALATMFFSFLKPGDTIIASQPLYGGSQELITGILSQYNIKSMIIDLSDIKKVESLIKADKSIKWMHIETPANPTIDCLDLEEITKITHQYKVKISVDNTFATPYLQQPFKYGVDFVVHSTTKYLNGHGTALGGILIGRDDENMEKALKWQRIMGNNSNPFDCFLLNQGLKTLELRMERHCQSAMKVAEYLEKHPLIEKVTYLGLKNHKDYEIAKKQMRLPGAVITFELKGGFNKAVKFMNSLKMCVRAVSLGSADTLISHPASTTHALQSREIRLKQGVTDGLVRISVGLETVDDIIFDLDQALCNSDENCKNKVQILNNLSQKPVIIQAKPKL